MSTKSISENIVITSSSAYIEQQSSVKDNRFVFAYKITISNVSDKTVQLISRHWIILDANNKSEEIYGEGVIGEKPIIKPGEKYSYTTGAILDTEIGTMEGRYFLIIKNDDKPSKIECEEIEVMIPRFTLSVPRTIH